MQYEVINSKKLAMRWDVPESWVRDQVRSRAVDPLPHVRLGRYIRFEWRSAELDDWWARHRRNGVPNRSNGDESKKGRIK